MSRMVLTYPDIPAVLTKAQADLLYAPLSGGGGYLPITGGTLSGMLAIQQGAQPGRVFQRPNTAEIGLTYNVGYGADWYLDDPAQPGVLTHARPDAGVAWGVSIWEVGIGWNTRPWYVSMTGDTFIWNKPLLVSPDAQNGLEWRANGLWSGGAFLPLAGGTLTGPLLQNLTWNNAGTTFAALRTNIINTASAVGSFVFDFQIGGQSVVSHSTAQNGTFVIRAQPPHGQAIAIIPRSDVTGGCVIVGAAGYSFDAGLNVGNGSATSNMVGLTNQASGTTRALKVGTGLLNLPPITAPSAPTNGDLWTQTDGVYARVNGVSTLLAAASLYLPLVGGALSGPLTIQSKAVTPSPDAGNSLTWNANGLFVPSSDLSGYYTKTQSDTRYVEAAGDTITGHITPGTTNTVDLGSASLRLRKVYATDLDVTNVPVSQTPVLNIPAGGLYTENIDDGNWARIEIAANPPNWGHWPARGPDMMFHPDQTNYCGLPKLTFPKNFASLPVKQVTVRINWWSDAGGWVRWYPYLVPVGKNGTYSYTGAWDGSKDCGVFVANAHLEDTFIWSLPGATYDDTTQIVGHIARLGGNAGDTCGGWARIHSVQIWFG
jgi:hypothetical protein